ncbi:MAG TPA: glycerophosphodiester phosphodiesterase family protein [Terracidiphilus sp.]|nr:glycerophosphodiester phosphodiesterase family protein [Terracidiphilus sp.]
MVSVATVAAQTCAPGINDGTTNGANSTFLGPNVYVITPSMWTCDIQALMNTLNQEAQFSTNRYAILFAPGTYGSSSLPLNAQVGYYEQIAGLGTTPTQTQVTGGFYANQIVLDGQGNSTGLTQNFWRSQENLSVTPTGGPTNGVLDWGVSQGASLRRMKINGDVWYANSTPVPNSADACAEASGGFTADTEVTGTTNFCSQQQWLTRDSSLDNGFTSFVWNFVFAGVGGNLPQPSFPGGVAGDANVIYSNVPISQEKPFLMLDGNGYNQGDYNVWVPTSNVNSSGTSWSSGLGSNGYALPISSFFIATPSTSVDDINMELLAGYSLILTPGVYQYSEAIHVTNPWTVILGLGYATIVPQAGNPAVVIDDVDGCVLAGVLVDAGPVASSVLVEVGQPGIVNQDHANPTALNDVFFRIGGGTQGSADTSLQVDSADVILDNIWAWRADHGNTGTFGWTTNQANHGLIVNGQHVTALGLAVEHYQQDQVVWNGDYGQTVFYQSEMPYDVPNQAAWTNSSGGNGYSSYVVSPGVCTHAAEGLGIYSFFNQGVNIVADSAIQAPASANIALYDLTTVFLNGSGQISSIVDGQGNVANSGDLSQPQQMASYSGSASCTDFSESPGSAVVPGLVGSIDPDNPGTTAVNYNPNGYNTDLIMSAVKNPHPDLTMISAHRGIHSLAGTTQGEGIAENGLRSIGEAAKEGWETIEIDAKYLTSDGKLILSHDATLGREWCGNRNGTGLATNWSYSPWILPGNSTNDTANPLITSLQLSDTRKWWSDNTVLRDTVSVINDYLANPNPSSQPWYGAACHSTFGLGEEYAPTLLEVYDYIQKNHIQMVIELDIQSVAVAQAAYNIVTSANVLNANGQGAYVSTIFKMPAALFPTPQDFANAFPFYQDVNFNPVFHTSGIAPVSSTNPFGSEQAMNDWINAYETYSGSFGNIPIVAIEVSMKDPVGTPNGGILSTVLPVAQNPSNPGGEPTTTISQFNPVGEYYPNNDTTQTPQFFSSKNGSCCEPLSTFLFNNPGGSACGTTYSNLPCDQNDNRPSVPFLVGMGTQMITTDLPGSAQTYLQSVGMRNTCYMQTAGCSQPENFVYNPNFAIGSTWWQDWTNDNNSLYNLSGYDEFWDSIPYQNQLYQWFTNLPNGTYTLSAWESDSGGENSAYMWSWSTATGYSTVNLSGSGNWTYIQIPNISVVDGQLEFALWADANAYDWVAFTGVSLYQN